MTGHPNQPVAPQELSAKIHELLQQELTDTGHDSRRADRRLDLDQARPLSLVGLVTSQRRLAAVAILAVTVVAVAGQLGPRIVGAAIDRAMVHGHSMTLLTQLAGLYLGLVALTVLAQRILHRTSGRLAARAMSAVRERVFGHLQRLSLDFFTRQKAGVLMTRATNDVENLQQFLQEGLVDITVQSLVMLVIITLLFTMSPPLTLLVLALALPLLLLQSYWFARVSTRSYQAVRDGIAAVMSDLSETLRGARVVTAHNRAPYNLGRHRTLLGDYRRANQRVARLTTAYGQGTQLLALGSQVVLLWFGGQMVLRDSLSLGELVAFFLYVNRLFQPIQLLVQQFTSFQQSQSSVIKLRALLEEVPSVRETADSVALPPLRGEIRLERVSFHYAPEQPVLTDVDLTISPGETVALVGRTGSGKSTLAKLIVRSYDVTSGRVLVDGYDVRDCTLASLRRQVSLVPQEAFLFATTLRENLAYGRPGATDGELWNAIRAVGLDELVERLPNGLDSVIHERGQSLSAGERQLVALARAFVAEPAVLLLDEATANLDLQSELTVDRALEALLANRTSIVIAHRLSTAMKSDRVVVMGEGRVIEMGPPLELLGANGAFAAMHRTWEAHGAAQP